MSTSYLCFFFFLVGNDISIGKKAIYSATDQRVKLEQNRAFSEVIHTQKVVSN